MAFWERLSHFCRILELNFFGKKGILSHYVDIPKYYFKPAEVLGF